MNIRINKNFAQNRSKKVKKGVHLLRIDKRCFLDCSLHPEFTTSEPVRAIHKHMFKAARLGCSLSYMCVCGLW